MLCLGLFAYLFFSPNHLREVSSVLFKGTSFLFICLNSLFVLNGDRFYYQEKHAREECLCLLLPYLDTFNSCTVLLCYDLYFPVPIKISVMF